MGAPFGLGQLFGFIADHRFADAALHLHAVTHGGFGLAGHVQAFGGQHIAVLLAVGRLQVEAVGIDGSHDTGGADVLALNRRQLRDTLDLSNGGRGGVIIGDGASAA